MQAQIIGVIDIWITISTVYLMIGLGISKVIHFITVHPEGDMNVSTKFHVNPSDCCYFTQNHKFQPNDGARSKVRGSQEIVGFILWEPWIGIQLIDV